MQSRFNHTTNEGQPRHAGILSGTTQLSAVMAAPGRSNAGAWSDAQSSRICMGLPREIKRLNQQARLGRGADPGSWGPSPNLTAIDLPLPKVWGSPNTEAGMHHLVTHRPAPTRSWPCRRRRTAFAGADDGLSRSTRVSVPGAARAEALHHHSEECPCTRPGSPKETPTEPPPHASRPKDAAHWHGRGTNALRPRDAHIAKTTFSSDAGSSRSDSWGKVLLQTHQADHRKLQPLLLCTSSRDTVRGGVLCCRHHWPVHPARNPSRSPSSFSSTEEAFTNSCRLRRRSASSVPSAISSLT